jgi:hypothetical protein
MKRAVTVFAVLVLPAWEGAYADSIPTLITQANISFGPSPGGDNQHSFFMGPGINLKQGAMRLAIGVRTSIPTNRARRCSPASRTSWTGLPWRET